MPNSTVVSWVECLSGYQPLADWIQGLLHRKESRPGSVYLVSEHMAQEIIGPSLEFTAVILLHDWVMLSNDFLNARIYLHGLVVHSALIRGMSYSSRQWLMQKAMLGQSAENKILECPALNGTVILPMPRLS